MPTFRYQTLAASSAGAAGNSSGAVIDAPDRASAVRELRRRGITPVSVEPLGALEARREKRNREQEGSRLHIDPPKRDSGRDSGRASGASSSTASSSSSSFGSSSRMRAMSRAEMAMFQRELATAVQAGLPLVISLKTIARQTRSTTHKAMINRLLDGVEHGRSLSESAAAIGKPFSELMISMTRALEASGRMGEILNQTATLLERDVKMRRQIVGGLIYPAVLAVLLSVAIGVMIGFIVPSILKPFAGKLATNQLPFPTQVTLAAGNFVTTFWWAILLAIAGGILLMQQLYRQPSSRMKIDRLVLRVPVLGTMLRDVAVTRFTRTLGTLVAAGLPALSALRITKATLGNKAMESVVDEVCDQVSAGKTIAEPMERSGYFPGLLVQVIALGERSGRLPQMLDQAANVFEDRTESAIKAFVNIFPVVLVIIAACVIGFVMAGVLLPLMQIQDLIGK